MKVCLFGISGIPIGKHNVKDSRLDEAHNLVEADKKTYIQVDVAEAKELPTADAIVVSEEGYFDLLLLDLEFIENRLQRNPPPGEIDVLQKAKSCLEGGRVMRGNGMNQEELKVLSIHTLYTLKPIVIASKDELNNFDSFLVRVLKESGYSCFFTVGGKENRAWLIKQGMTAVEAAGVIHSDIQKGFIRAEVISWDDFIQHGGETGAKRAGKLRLEPKTYIMQECDVVNFRFNK
ncbi:MAG: DUF933 domain-containing protein [Verrucomicrobiae bacterium]|nr:DUF933 domain-containing protein [Verrucomicrobiae bacterium]